MTPEQAEDLQKKYVTSRKRWARKIGFPYSWDLAEPDPAVIDGADEENG